MSEYEVNRTNINGKKMMLIESDAGFISSSDDRNKAFISEMRKLDSGSHPTINEPLIVYVVLQKWGVKNRNGRIYPKNILERENDRYQELIRDRRAIGECVPEDTDVFTKNGWVSIKDVMVGDEIYTLNVGTNEMEVQKVYDTIKKPYNDDLVHIYNHNTLDMKLTKNHKMILWDRNDNQYEMTAINFHNALLKGDSKVSHSKIKYSGDWSGNNDEYFTLPNTNIKINIHDWAAFLGIFISEGHTSGSKGDKVTNKVTITQTKESQKKLITDLLDKLPFKYTISDNRQFNIYDKDLYEHLSILSDSYKKHIPEYAKNWSKEILNTLLTWLLIGDGRNRHNTKGELLREYYTTSPKLSEDVFELFLKLGSGASINTRKQVDRYITDIIVNNIEIDNGDGTVSLIKKEIKNKRLIKKENSKLLYIISEKKSTSVTLDKRYTKVELEKFNDNVYCVSVPNKTWLMRYNNKVAWTHNCDHPESSIISTDRISHNITETWWENKTLMGKMEILMSPGYINYGIVSTKGDEVANLLRNNIMIGVSSRGVGSLREVNGEQVVQDDFEIICWDVVTAPSTPGSWMFKDKSEARPFKESVEGRTDLLSNGLDKFLLD
jgi:hypothetical protein